ncbi:glycogen synthase, partial [Candidatus Desantisbacteria bacterium]|nr:glycogen synthase [Candidatus Desantisbacteria bacterium]
MIKLNLGYPDNTILHKPKILFAASEVAPLAKTGGLADVAGELPHALKNMGCDVRIVLPFYGSISKNKFAIKPLITKIKIPVANSIYEEINLYETEIFNNIPVYLISHDRYFNREGLYGSNKSDYPDNDKRFILFCRSVMEMIPAINFIPDIIHTNDWQTGLIPLYLKNFYKYDKTYSVFTIHNLAYQGIFPHSSLEFAGISDEYFNMDALEFYGKISFIKSGIIYSDMITTVSEQYSKEIQTREFGCGLDGLLRKKKHQLTGIINGIDYKIWDPGADSRIKSKYNEKNINGKKNCKS